jgi:integrase
VVAEYLVECRRRATEGVTNPSRSIDPTINEVLLSFWRHAERHYRTPEGKTSSELGNFRDTFRPLKKLYGTSLASQFSPLKLKALRQVMMDSGLCRNTINQRIGRIVHVFKWAASEELLPATVHQALKTVSGLQKGRSDAKESEPVRPVPDALVDAIRPFVSRQVWAMIELQRLTGMRPGEVVKMRAVDLDTSGTVWAYVPPDHKMLYRGRERRIYLGIRAQTILKPWLKSDPLAFLFSPAEARGERRDALRASRKTPVQPSQRDRSKEKPKRPPGQHFTPQSYHHAIRNACKRAGVTSWHPNQLRHSFATMLRKECGLDAARVILGHTSPAVTEMYAEKDFETARSVIERLG